MIIFIILGCLAFTAAESVLNTGQTASDCQIMKVMKTTSSPAGAKTQLNYSPKNNVKVGGSALFYKLVQSLKKHHQVQTFGMCSVLSAES